MTHRPVATAGGEPLGPAVASFLAERDLAPSSHRVYVLALHRLLDRLGADTPLAEVSPRMLAEFMTATYPHLAPASYNRVVATPRLAVRLRHPPGLDPDLAGHRLGTPPPPVGPGRAHARARAIPALELLAFLDADHPLREKTLWRLLYETAARAGEVLALNVADLDLAARRAVVVGKGGRAEVIDWETKTARLLPRHLHRRRASPLFLTDIAPAPARQPALADFDPATGRARLTYRRAAEIFTTAGGGWTLHQLRQLPAHPPRRSRCRAPDADDQKPAHQPGQPRDLRQAHLRRGRRHHRRARPRPTTLTNPTSQPHG